MCANDTGCCICYSRSEHRIRSVNGRGRDLIHSGLKQHGETGSLSNPSGAKFPSLETQTLVSIHRWVKGTGHPETSFAERGFLAFHPPTAQCLTGDDKVRPGGLQERGRLEKPFILPRRRGAASQHALLSASLLVLSRQHNGNHGCGSGPSHAMAFISSLNSGVSQLLA